MGLVWFFFGVLLLSSPLPPPPNLELLRRARYMRRFHFSINGTCGGRRVRPRTRRRSTWSFNEGNVITSVQMEGDRRGQLPLTHLLGRWGVGRGWQETGPQESQCETRLVSGCCCCCCCCCCRRHWPTDVFNRHRRVHFLPSRPRPPTSHLVLPRISFSLSNLMLRHTASSGFIWLSIFGLVLGIPPQSKPID